MHVRSPHSSPQHRCIPHRPVHRPVLRCRAQSSDPTSAFALDSVPLEQRQLFVFGLGYVATGLVNGLVQHGWKVDSTTRFSPAAAQPAPSPQHHVHAFNPGAPTAAGSPSHGLDADGLAALLTAPYVLSTIPPLGLELYDPFLRAQLRLLRQAASAGPPGRLRWVGYLSSTSVYGDWGGDWVDEASECRAGGAKGLVRLDAEQAWGRCAEAAQLPLAILRLGGIYGPGRSVLDAVRREATAAAAAAEVDPSASTATAAAGLQPSVRQKRRQRQRYTARCHALDICGAVQASMARPPAPGAARVYNVTDDEPAPRSDVMRHARTLLGLTQPADDGGGTAAASAPPPASAGGAEGAAALRTPPLTTPAAAVVAAAAAAAVAASAVGDVGGIGGGRSGVLEEKRVSNRRMREELGVGLAFPSYREALAAMVAGDVRPFEAHDLAPGGVAAGSGAMAEE